MQFNFEHIAKLPRFSTEQRRWGLAQQLNEALEGAAIRDGQVSAWPSINLRALASLSALSQFFRIYENAAEHARATEHAKESA